MVDEDTLNRKPQALPYRMDAPRNQPALLGQRMQQTNAGLVEVKMPLEAD